MVGTDVCDGVNKIAWTFKEESSQDVVVVDDLEVFGRAVEEGEVDPDPAIGSTEDIREGVVDVDPCELDSMGEVGGKVRGKVAETEVIGEIEEVEVTVAENKVEENEAELCVVEDEEEEDKGGTNVRIVFDRRGACRDVFKGRKDLLDESGVHNFM